MIDRQEENRLAVAKLVSEARHRKGFTQRGLARLAGVSVRQIAHLEAGHVEAPRLQTWRKLRTVLDLPVLDDVN